MYSLRGCSIRKAACTEHAEGRQVCTEEGIQPASFHAHRREQVGAATVALIAGYEDGTVALRQRLRDDLALGVDGGEVTKDAGTAISAHAIYAYPATHFRDATPPKRTVLTHLPRC